MGQTNMLCEWDYPMCPGNGHANVLYEWDYSMCPGNWASQCTLGMGLANVP